MGSRSLLRLLVTLLLVGPFPSAAQFDCGPNCYQCDGHCDMGCAAPLTWDDCTAECVYCERGTTECWLVAAEIEGSSSATAIGPTTTGGANIDTRVAVGRGKPQVSDSDFCARCLSACWCRIEPYCYDDDDLSELGPARGLRWQGGP